MPDCEHSICDCIVQFVYNLCDLDAQLRQVIWYALSERSDFQPLLVRSRSELIPIGDAIAGRGMTLGCEVNGTVRWVAAGTNLHPFPTGLHATLTQVSILLSGYSKLSDSCQIGIHTTRRHGDATTAELFESSAIFLSSELLRLESLLDSQQS